MEHSVTIWLRRLASGDQAAAQVLWDRYGPTLVDLARRRYRGAIGAAGDEEDLVASVFEALWKGATKGHFDKVRDREQLWWLLLRITRCSALNRQAYNSIRPRTVPLDGGLSSNNPASRVDPEQPPPDLILMLDEQQHRLLGLLRNDVLRSIAVWRLEGYSNEEIAAQLGVTTRTVIRKLKLIRERWEEAAQEEEQKEEEL